MERVWSRGAKFAKNELRSSRACASVPAKMRASPLLSSGPLRFDSLVRNWSINVVAMCLPSAADFVGSAPAFQSASARCARCANGSCSNRTVSASRCSRISSSIARSSAQLPAKKAVSMAHGILNFALVFALGTAVDRPGRSSARVVRAWSAGGWLRPEVSSRSQDYRELSRSRDGRICPARHVVGVRSSWRIDQMRVACRSRAGRHHGAAPAPCVDRVQG